MKKNDTENEKKITQKKKKKGFLHFRGQNAKISYIEFFKPKRRGTRRYALVGIFYNIHYYITVIRFFYPSIFDM